MFCRYSFGFVIFISKDEAATAAANVMCPIETRCLSNVYNNYLGRHAYLYPYDFGSFDSATTAISHLLLQHQQTCRHLRAVDQQVWRNLYWCVLRFTVATPWNSNLEASILIYLRQSCPSQLVQYRTRSWYYFPCAFLHWLLTGVKGLLQYQSAENNLFNDKLANAR